MFTGEISMSVIVKVFITISYVKLCKYLIVANSWLNDSQLIQIVAFRLSGGRVDAKIYTLRSRNCSCIYVSKLRSLFNISLERIQAEERKLKMVMDERLPMEKLTVEKMKVEMQEKIAIVNETGNDNKIKGKANSVRLPRLELRAFDGNILKW